jgi:hypothetical protein
VETYTYLTFTLTLDGIVGEKITPQRTRVHRGIVGAAALPLSDLSLSLSLGSCVPQYDGDPMPEVLRSKLFYARSAAMLAIPTYQFISDLQSIQMGILNSLLASVSKALVPSMLFASADGLMTQVVLDVIIAKGRYASREYFGR